jgi:hypothetical protein
MLAFLVDRVDDHANLICTARKYIFLANWSRRAEDGAGSQSEFLLLGWCHGIDPSCDAEFIYN